MEIEKRKRSSSSPATSESEKVRFHTLNRETGNRVVSQYVDAVTRKPVQDDDEVKGYARGENDYVLLTDDELDAVALDPQGVADTLGVLLKYQDDIQKMQGGEAKAILDEVRQGR